MCYDGIMLGDVGNGWNAFNNKIGFETKLFDFELFLASLDINLEQKKQ